MGGRLSVVADFRAVCGGRARFGGLLLDSPFVETVCPAGAPLATGSFTEFFELAFFGAADAEVLGFFVAGEPV